MSPIQESSDDSTSTTDVAAEKANTVAATAQDKAGAVAEEAKDHAQQLLAESRQSVRAQAEVQGEQLSSTAKDLASELKSMAAAGEGRLGGLVEQGADQLSRLADRFDEGGIEAVGGDARRYARNRPFMFVATTFVAGFAAGRLLKHADNDELKSAATPDSGESSAGQADEHTPAASSPPPALTR